MTTSMIYKWFNIDGFIFTTDYDCDVWHHCQTADVKIGHVNNPASLQEVKQAIRKWETE